MNFELSFISNKKNCLKENVFHAKKERKRVDDDDDAMLSNSAINEVTHIMYFLQFFFLEKKTFFCNLLEILRCKRNVDFVKEKRVFCSLNCCGEIKCNFHSLLNKKRKRNQDEKSWKCTPTTTLNN
jgi:hypothetical protein